MDSWSFSIREMTSLIAEIAALWALKAAANAAASFSLVALPSLSCLFKSATLSSAVSRSSSALPLSYLLVLMVFLAAVTAALNLLTLPLYSAFYS